MSYEAGAGPVGAGPVGAGPVGAGPVGAGPVGGAAHGVGEPRGAGHGAAEAPAVVYQAKVLTVSDSVMRGEREDESGPAVARALEKAGFEVVERALAADGVASVAGDLVRMASAFTGLVVTTGGTGFGPRDQTPEGTAEVIERAAPGFGELMRRSSPLAPLSRGIAGVRGRSLVLNLPGSPKGAIECLDALMGLLPHALSLLAEDQRTEHS